MTAILTPSHPGRFLKEDVLLELGINLTEAATQLGVSRVTLSRIVNGQSAISTDMAIRLEIWLKGISAEDWLHKQTEYDLWQERQKSRPEIRSVEGRQIIIKELKETLADEKSNADFRISSKAERAIASVIGLKLKEARQLCEHNVDQASQLLGISTKDLKYFEKGFGIEYFPLQIIKRSAEIYFVSVDWLFGLVEDDWELAPEVRITRDYMSIIEKLRIESDERMNRKLIRMNNKVLAIAKSVTTMVKAYKEIDVAFMRFRDLNPRFKQMQGGNILLEKTKQAVEDGKTAICLLVRHKLLPSSELVSLHDTK